MELAGPRRELEVSDGDVALRRSETASAVWIVPAVRCPGGNPVTALPGLTPMLSLLMVGPVLVTVEPASTANACAVPRIEVVWTTDDVRTLGICGGPRSRSTGRGREEETGKDGERRRTERL
jgi:hypothetical protein